jgi:transposase
MPLEVTLPRVDADWFPPARLEGVTREMSIVADQFDVVIGVDTHTDTHTAAVLDRRGVVLAELAVTADADGALALLALAEQHASTGARLWAVEGTRAHGLGLCRVLTGAGEHLTEAPAPAAARRRRGGKSDTLDAVHAARAVLATDLDQLVVPRADGDREALRILLTCRRHYSDMRTATINLIKSLILTADEPLRAALRGRSTTAQIRHLTNPDPDPHTGALTDEARTRRHHLRTLAEQVNHYTSLLAANKTDLHTLVTALCPPLLDQPGIGPVTAAVALTVWSHPHRVRSEAAFAALAGTNPIPASSGRTTRHRLNPGGDRTLNAALHTIVLTRRRHHQATRDYVTRRTTEGKTSREINRCLKRYTARQIYRTIQTHNKITT